MRTVFLLITTLFVTLNSYGQVTDNEIIKATMGKRYADLHQALDSLGVWYALHQDNDQGKAERGVVDKKKIYSISDGKGVSGCNF